jgi:chitin disaccharide deacetylase
LSREFRRRAGVLGVRTNPGFAGTYAFRSNADFSRLFPHFLDGLPDGGVVMCHPGFVDAELGRLDPLTTLREREYAFLADDAFPALLARHGVTLAPA